MSISGFSQEKNMLLSVWKPLEFILIFRFLCVSLISASVVYCFMENRFGNTHILSQCFQSAFHRAPPDVNNLLKADFLEKENETTSTELC